jgi:hypothetical protein
MTLVKGNGGALGRRSGQHGGVTDLLWDDVKCFFDLDLMGSLPDVRVPNASMEDWQAVLDLVAEKDWKYRYSEGETVLPVPRAETVLSRPADAECPDLRSGRPPMCWRSSVSTPTTKSTSTSTCGSCRARTDLMCSANSFGGSGGGWANRC